VIASLITAMYLIGFISQDSAITSLYVAGILLIIAELGVVSFGLIAVNGLLALYAGYAIHSGNDLLFGITMGWPILFGIAFVEISIIASVVSVHLWLRRRKATTGKEGMVGAKAKILKWKGTKGSINIDGEIWNASSEKEMDLNPDDEVTIKSVDKLNITITA